MAGCFTPFNPSFEFCRTTTLGPPRDACRSTPTGVVSNCIHGEYRAATPTQPLWGCTESPRRYPGEIQPLEFTQVKSNRWNSPRVAPAAQPWALLHNPFGVERINNTVSVECLIANPVLHPKIAPMPKRTAIRECVVLL